MEKMNIKILVATHKNYEMPKEECYVPIHVGAANSTIDLGYQKDNIGDNISLENKNYCELTAIYWAWKNLDCDAVGLVHYRRHFTKSNKKSMEDALNLADYERLLNDYDILVPKKRNYWIESNYSHYIHAHHREPLDQTRKIMEQLHPEYLHSFDQVMKDTKAHMFNMFVMKKNVYNDYCQWLFSILFGLEKHIDISQYNSYEARVYGFISELLLDVWLYKNEYKFKEINWTHMEKEALFRKGVAMIKRKMIKNR